MREKFFDFGALRMIGSVAYNSLKPLAIGYNKISEELNRNALR